MIDALLYAVRDAIRSAGIGYGAAECEIMEDDEGRPPPRCGNYFAAVHSGVMRGDADNQLNEWYEFALTLTMRVTVPLDRAGDQLMARNVPRVPLGERQGFYARTDRLRALLHMNWGIVVSTGQQPLSANDNLQSWANNTTGSVYGFCEPMRFLSLESPKVVHGDWFGAEPGDDTAMGLKARLSFGRARRMQPQTNMVGPFA